ncbi:MAG: class I SAM-dependent methyltransferase, partial [Salinibacter sp.]
SLEAVVADVRTWRPERRWDAVVVTFRQLLPSERPDLYRTIRAALRPGGLVLGEWFRPNHLGGPYDRMGPSTADRMVPPTELRAAFAADEIVSCEAADVTLVEGPLLRGDAAVVRLRARRTAR